MAKKGKLEQNARRLRLYKQHAEKRAALKAIAKQINSTPEERIEALNALARLPRNSNPNRIRNRCSLTGRPRGFYRKFGISRIALRELSHMGEIPGSRKASW